MMRLQPLSGAYLPTTAMNAAPRGAASGFDDAVSASVARQDVPGGDQDAPPWERADAYDAPAAGTPTIVIEAVPGGGQAGAGATSGASSGGLASAAAPAATRSMGMAAPSVSTAAPASAQGTVSAQAPATGAASATASTAPTATASTNSDAGFLSPTQPIPAPLQIGASIALGAAMGNPLTAVQTVFMGLVAELARMGPDLSRPAMPAGMQQGHCQAGIEPVSPGTLKKGEYLTLATTTPAFLANGSTPAPALASADGAAGPADGSSATTACAPMVGLMAHYAGMDAYQRREALEKGIY